MPSLLPGSTLFLTPLLPFLADWLVELGTVIDTNSYSLLLFPAHTFPLLQGGSLPQAAVLEELLQHCTTFQGVQYFRNKLLQYGLLSMGCSS